MTHVRKEKRTMSEQENLNVVQANYDAFNAHNLERLSQWWAADFLAEQTGESVPFNGEQHRMFLQSYLTAFPDAHIDVTLMIAQGDYVFVHWTATGTHTGPLHTATGSPIPATGKQVALKASETYQLHGGKISHLWGFFDRVSLLGQLGVMPSM
jgi:steroid delta-isomerase-like uncharacterized protein